MKPFYCLINHGKYNKAQQDWKSYLILHNFNSYYTNSNKEFNSIPNVKEIASRGAISLLENLGLKVQLEGKGKVIEQSLEEGVKLEKGKTIKIKLA